MSALGRRELEAARNAWWEKYVDYLADCARQGPMFKGGNDPLNFDDWLIEQLEEATGEHRAA
jgi:hypothetical protein